MIYLLGSIVLSSWLTLSFKFIERYRIPTLQAIVVNYFVCVITGALVQGDFPFSSTTLNEKWFPWALVMGTTFIVSFNIIGFTAQRMGVAVASVANKLSLVVPFLFSIYLYQESVTVLKVAGILLALVSVWLTSMPNAAAAPSGVTQQTQLLWLPVLLFVGSGLIDTMIKYVETSYLNRTNQNAFLISAFLVAGLFGLMYMMLGIYRGNIQWDKRSLWAGLIIGVPNYFSIWCLVQVLKAYTGNSTAIIPVNNVGIVLFSTLMAMWLFREQLSAMNWTGIALAVIAIAMIAFG
ncbi:MAG: hypothetical protein ACO3BD_01680 [Chitinophagaceae bacterium]